MSVLILTAAAFLGGAAVAYLNYRINLRALRKKPDMLASLSIVRELLSVLYLLLVYVFSARVPGGRVPMLIGAAVGLTVPSVLLSLRLAKISEAAAAQPEELSGEGGDQDG